MPKKASWYTRILPVSWRYAWGGTKRLGKGIRWCWRKSLPLRQGLGTRVGLPVRTWAVQHRGFLLMVGLVLAGITVLALNSSFETPKVALNTALLWAGVIGIVLLVFGLALLPTWLAHRRSHPKPKKEKKDKAEVQIKEVYVKDTRSSAKAASKSGGGNFVPLVSSLALVAGLIWLMWFFNREPNPVPAERPMAAREASTRGTAANPVTAVVNALIPKASPCGEKVVVKAPISLDDSQWSDFVAVPPQCQPVPSIAHETGLYRYRCKDKDGNGPFEEETGKCAAGVTAYSFQKRSPLTKEGEEMPIEEYMAPLELTLTFKQLG